MAVGAVGHLHGEGIIAREETGAFCDLCLIELVERVGLRPVAQCVLHDRVFAADLVAVSQLVPPTANEFIGDSPKTLTLYAILIPSGNISSSS